MAIKAEVTNGLQFLNADVEFSESALSFYGPSWEIGLFFGLLPIRGKKKELLRVAYSDIAEVKVGKRSTLINKKDACWVKLQNGVQLEICFIPFESGRAMLFEKVADRFLGTEVAPL